jgi:hypothetical protein
MTQPDKIRITDWRARWTAKLLLLALCGCQSADEGVHVHGTVTFDGVPVPRGAVVIQPDRSKGNRGRQGYAEIHNGQFDTRAEFGKGAATGAVVVIVTGGDGKGATAMAPFGGFWLKEYVEVAELPPEGADLRIDVPKSAGISAP